MRRALLAALLAGSTAITACHHEGGPLYSADRYTYISREWQPWTVTLVDTRTGESLWSVDVPVGQQLVVGFRKGTGPNQFKPDMMYWGLREAGRTYGESPNQLPVPPAAARRLEPTLRPTPELPGSPGAGNPFDTLANAPAPPITPAASAEVPNAPAAQPMSGDDVDPAVPAETASPTPEQPAEPPVDLPQGTRKPS